MKANVGNTPVNLKLWDTAGQEKYANLVPIYVRDSNLVIIVYDLTNPNPLANVQSYYQKIRDIVPAELPVIICGNKLDLSPNPGTGRDVNQWAATQNIQFFPVSAKTGQGIDDMFQEASSTAHQKAIVVNQVNTRLRVEREKAENPSSCGC